MLFMKRLIGVEFFFALLPLVLLSLLNIRGEYESSQLGRAVSYNLLLAMGMTTLQVLILAAVFVTWYVPFYQIDDTAIVYKRGGLLGDRKLGEPSAVANIEVRQGWLARRLDYGTLVITNSTLSDKSQVRDIPNPVFYAHVIEDLANSETVLRPAFEATEVNEIIPGGENQYVELATYHFPRIGLNERGI